MFSLRHRIVRQALAMLLLALCAVVSVQRAQVVVNDVQHGLAIDHTAPALELASAVDDHHGSGPHDDHHDQAPAAAADAGDDGKPAGPHHHHAEGPQVAALPTQVPERVLQGRAESLAMASDQGAPRVLIFGLERPPKALGAHRA